MDGTPSPTWAEVAWRLWRRGYTPEQIAYFLRLEGWRLNGREVRENVNARGARQANAWVAERIAAQEAEKAPQSVPAASGHPRP